MVMSESVISSGDMPSKSELHARMEQLGKPTQEFFVLLAAATLIADLGLFENSATVIIGAMLIAPLMRPLMALAYGSLIADSGLLKRSTNTLVSGILLVVFLGYFVAIALHSIDLTSEMLARTRPTLLDLAVACVAGAIGAYCQTKQDLSASLAGVAISVALVPPLSLVGVGMAAASFEVARGAGLLFLTNFVGITGFAAVVFLLRGYSQFHEAKRGIFASIFAILLLTIPLGYSMRELILENALSREIKYLLKEKTHTFSNIVLDNIEVHRFQSPMDVIATVYGSPQEFTPKQVWFAQEFLIREIGTKLSLRLRIIPLVELDATEVSTEGSKQILRKDPHKTVDGSPNVQPTAPAPIPTTVSSPTDVTPSAPTDVAPTTTPSAPPPNTLPANEPKPTEGKQ
jgi:uncharacterized hydrophobic protein (TIGR00271 family)